MVTTTIKQDQIKMRDYIKRKNRLKPVAYPAAVMQTGPYMAAVSLLDTYMLSHGDFTCKRSLKMKGKELHLLSSVLDLRS